MYASDFSHEIGEYTDPGSPGTSYWQSPAGKAPGYLLYGPYAVLPAGKYRVVFDMYGGSNASTTVDVVQNGACGGSVGGLCGTPMAVNTGQSSSKFEYSFSVLQDCQDKWEIRIHKNDTGLLYFYSLYLYYDGP
jgi:hypothetical protein